MFQQILRIQSIGYIAKAFLFQHRPDFISVPHCDSYQNQCFLPFFQLTRALPKGVSVS